jgi:hypothetical protein
MPPDYYMLVILLLSILIILVIIIITMDENLKDKFSNLMGNTNDDTDILKLFPFMDDIIYQNPDAINRRGYDILDTKYNIKKIGPVINFHQQFNPNTMKDLGWRTWYLKNFC